MHILKNYIGGEWLEPNQGKYIDNFRPRDGALLGKIPDSSREDINHAVAAAQRAFPSWSRSTCKDRAAILLRIAASIEAKADLFAETESEDQGKPVSLARSMDIPRAIDNFRFFGNAILQQTESAFYTEPQLLNYVRREAVGVAGLIAPWNLPLYLLTWKIAPALAFGNTAVAKPSEMTSATANLLSEVFAEVGLPAGVCNIVYGRGAEAGDALVAHPNVPLISFTGGTATAEKIVVRSAPHFKKTSLELGGKNAALIFADCQFENTLAGTTRSAMLNQGEICLCTSRVLVEKSLFQRFTEAFVESVKALSWGDPRLKDTFMGPLVSAQHRQKVHAYVQRAKEQGFQVLCGGEMPRSELLSQGYYYPPTVIICQDPQAEIMQEEVFGPVVTLSSFDTFEDGLAMANVSRYGLAATVWTQNLGLAHRAAAALQVGQVWINCWMKRDLRAPFGGMKHSGIGREGGYDSYEFYTEAKNVCLNYDA